MEWVVKTKYFFLSKSAHISLIFETMKPSLAWNEYIGPEKGPTQPYDHMMSSKLRSDFFNEILGHKIMKILSKSAHISVIFIQQSCHLHGMKILILKRAPLNHMTIWWVVNKNRFFFKCCLKVHTSVYFFLSNEAVTCMGWRYWSWKEPNLTIWPYDE